MLKQTKVPFVNGVGKTLPHLEKGVRYTFVDHGYYMTALRPGETEEIKPELPEQEWAYRQQHPIKEWRIGGRHREIL